MQGACERRDLQPLRGRRPFLARLVLLRQGADLRRRALVRLHDRGQRQGGDDETPRQPRVRHGQSAGRPHLRKHLLPLRRQVHERLGAHQQVGGAGLQVTRLPL